jgi:hypothetical protein
LLFELVFDIFVAIAVDVNGAVVLILDDEEEVGFFFFAYGLYEVGCLNDDIEVDGGAGGAGITLYRLF